MACQIFISYRRDRSEYLGKLLYDRLTAKGYTVFYDVESLHTGNYIEQLYEHIDNCDFFLLLLAPHSLDKCITDSEDWVLKETARAISKKKKIIPITMRGFEGFPPNLPPSIDPIRDCQCLDATVQEYFDAAFEKLCSDFLKATPSENKASRFPKSFQKELNWKRLALLFILASLIVAATTYVRYAMAKSENPPLGSETALVGDESTAAEDLVGNPVEQEDIEIDANVETAEAIPPEVFWGTHTYTESLPKELSNLHCTYQKADDIELELIALPQSMTVTAENPNQMILTFQDKYGVTFNFISDYSIEEGLLTLSEPSDYTENEDPLYKLTNKLQYELKISYNTIKLVYENQSRKYKNLGRGVDSITLQGTACSENDIFNGILSVDVDVETGSDRTCQLFFEGGGYSTDAILSDDSYDACVYIDMNEEIIPYNGRMQENRRLTRYRLDYFNTYPYGFIIKNSGNYYRYQDTVMKISESSESTTN